MGPLKHVLLLVSVCAGTSMRVEDEKLGTRASEIAKRIHAQVLKQQCEAVREGEDEETFEESWCPLVCYARYLIAYDYPGALTAQYADPTELGSMSLKMLDRELHELMIGYALEHMESMEAAHPELTAFNEAEVKAMQKPTDVYKTLLKGIIRLSGLPPDKHQKLLNVWSLLCKVVYKYGKTADIAVKDTEMGLTVAEAMVPAQDTVRREKYSMSFRMQMYFQSIRLQIIKDVGLERQSSDAWSVAIHLLTVTFMADQCTAERIRYSKTMLRCHVQPPKQKMAGGKPHPQCQQVPFKSSEVHMALTLVANMHSESQDKPTDSKKTRKYLESELKYIVDV